MWHEHKCVQHHRPNVGVPTSHSQGKRHFTQRQVSLRDQPHMSQQRPKPQNARCSGLPLRVPRRNQDLSSACAIHHLKTETHLVSETLFYMYLEIRTIDTVQNPVTRNDIYRRLEPTESTLHGNFLNLLLSEGNILSVEGRLRIIAEPRIFSIPRILTVRFPLISK